MDFEPVIEQPTQTMNFPPAEPVKVAQVAKVAQANPVVEKTENPLVEMKQPTGPSETDLLVAKIKA